MGSNLLIFESFRYLIRGSPFAEWSDSDAINRDEDPGDVPGSNVFVTSLAVLMGRGFGCSTSLSSGALGARSPLQFLSVHRNSPDNRDRGGTAWQYILEAIRNPAGWIQWELACWLAVLGMAAHASGFAYPY